jgi:hypothetical protein
MEDLMYTIAEYLPVTKHAKMRHIFRRKCFVYVDVYNLDNRYMPKDRVIEATGVVTDRYMDIIQFIARPFLIADREFAWKFIQLSNVDCKSVECILERHIRADLKWAIMMTTIGRKYTKSPWQIYKDVHGVYPSTSYIEDEYKKDPSCDMTFAAWYVLYGYHRYVIDDEMHKRAYDLFTGKYKDVLFYNHGPTIDNNGEVQYIGWKYNTRRIHPKDVYLITQYNHFAEAPDSMDEYEIRWQYIVFRGYRSLAHDDWIVSYLFEQYACLSPSGSNRRYIGGVRNKRTVWYRIQTGQPMEFINRIDEYQYDSLL